MNNLGKNTDFSYICSPIKCDFWLSLATEILMLNKFSDIIF